VRITFAFALSLLLPTAALAAEASPSGERDEAMGRRLQALLKSHGGEVHACYAAALDKDQRAKGEVLVRVQVGEGHKVAQAEILKDQASAPEIGACLVRAIRGWSLRELEATAGDQIVFPLVFHPDEQGSAKTPAKARKKGNKS
jgi:hypothetical protein